MCVFALCSVFCDWRLYDVGYGGTVARSRTPLRCGGWTASGRKKRYSRVHIIYITVYRYTYHTLATNSGRADVRSWSGSQNEKKNASLLGCSRFPAGGERRKFRRGTTTRPLNFSNLCIICPEHTAIQKCSCQGSCATRFWRLVPFL